MVKAEGWEADDVIGTLARRIAPLMDVVIVSGDKDMAQLVGVWADGYSVSVFNTGKNKLLGVSKFRRNTACCHIR
jgi:5'-3' exonuclease